MISSWALVVGTIDLTFLASFVCSMQPYITRHHFVYWNGPKDIEHWELVIPTSRRIIALGTPIFFTDKRFILSADFFCKVFSSPRGEFTRPLLAWWFESPLNFHDSVEAWNQEINKSSAELTMSSDRVPNESRTVAKQHIFATSALVEDNKNRLFANHDLSNMYFFNLERLIYVS